MRTIGRHWPAGAPRGDYRALCDYCGAKWRRSQLRRNGAQFLVCDLCDGDRHYARPAHIPNNEGTGASAEPSAVQSDPFPVLL